ncbi:hypothetical protein GOODEAATRI_002051 [Goodea atripinnis]|uniref:Uncharacterized protein n=1 Tax=Goodea atripinnis TaxID=208336 RepID=A0ABV0NK47_9TELE
MSKTSHDLCVFSYRRFNHFDELSGRFWLRSWAGSADSLDNPAFLRSDELLHLRALDRPCCYHDDTLSLPSTCPSHGTRINTIYPHRDGCHALGLYLVWVCLKQDNATLKSQFPDQLIQPAWMSSAVVTSYIFPWRFSPHSRVREQSWYLHAPHPVAAAEPIRRRPAESLPYMERGCSSVANKVLRVIGLHCSRAQTPEEYTHRSGYTTLIALLHRGKRNVYTYLAISGCVSYLCCLKRQGSLS